MAVKIQNYVKQKICNRILLKINKSIFYRVILSAIVTNTSNDTGQNRFINIQRNISLKQYKIHNNIE